MRRLRADERGAVAVEYAVVLPALLAFALAVIDLSRLVWTEVTLDRAVQSAARCAVVNATLCGSNAAISAYASTQAWGLTAPAQVFTVTNETCGVTVRAQMSFRYFVPWPMLARNATASACYPLN